MAISKEEFFATLARSGLLTDEQLAEAETHNRNIDDPTAVARSLVEREWITRWQAGQLLAGRSSFFLGKYKLIELLGRGGMGSVFLGEHTTMDRLVALKILSRQIGKNPASLERFLSEARAIAALDHPNIVRAYSVDHEADRYYIVMEYIDGRDLRQIVDADGPLDYETAADYIRQAADGLAHGHRQEMIHCDVKPSNLLVGNQGVVKIVDMGLARLTDDDTAQHDDEHLLGSVDYLAPEQGLRSADFDHRADVYALGCTLYFLLTGHPPFHEGLLHERLMKHQSVEPPSVLQERPDAPKELAELCRRMMAKKPDDRPQSAEEVSRVLSRRRPPVRKPPPTTVPPVRTPNGSPDSTPPETAPPETAPLANGLPSIVTVDTRRKPPVTNGARPATALPTADAAAGRRKILLWAAGIAIILAVAATAVAITLLITGGGGSGEENGNVAASGQSGQDGDGRSSPKDPGLAADQPLDEDPPPPDDEPPADPPAGDDAPGDDTPGDDTPGDDTPGDDTPGDDAPGDDAPGDDAPGDDAPGDDAPGDDAPGDDAPGDDTPGDDTPGDDTPGDDTPGDDAPGDDAPGDPEPPKKPDPFRDLAATAELPALKGTAEKPEAPALLGTLHVDAESAWGVELLGGEGALKGNRKFVMARGQGGTDWQIQLESPARPGEEPERTDMARVWLEGQSLQFAWGDEVSEAKTAAFLQNCGLKITVDDKSRLLPLGQPTELEPLPIDLAKGTRSLFLPADRLGDPEKLHLQVTDVSGQFPQYEFRPGDAAAAGDKINLVLLEAGIPEFKFEVSLDTKGRRPCVNVSACFTPPGHTEPAPFRLTTAGQWVGQAMATKQQLSRYKVKTEDQKKAIAGQIKVIDAGLKQMEALSAVCRRIQNGKLHFRVFTTVEDQQIDIFITPPPAPEPPPEDGEENQLEL